MPHIVALNESIQGTKTVDFFSNYSLLDADIIVWNYDYTVREINRKKIDYKNKQVIGIYSDRHEELEKSLDYRIQQFRDFFEMGRLLVLTVPLQPQELRMPVVSMQGIECEWNFSLRDIIPIPPFEIKEERGEVVSLSQSNMLMKDFALYDRLIFKYLAKIVGGRGIPILVANKTSNVVGMHFPLSKGNVLLLPPLLDDRESVSRQFLEGLSKIFKELPKTSISENDPLPAWANETILDGEGKQRAAMLSLIVEKERLEIKIVAQKELLSRFDKLKYLFCGSGLALEQAVQFVLAEMGFTLNPTEANRDDLIVNIGGRHAVIEVKGVKGSAAERNAAQLEKWTTTYYDATGVRPKGILIVNAYKDLQLDKRKEPVFPPQMLDYSMRREHCLVSGITLLDLYTGYKNETVSQDQIVKMLFETNGVLEWNRNTKLAE